MIQPEQLTPPSYMNVTELLLSFAKQADFLDIKATNLYEKGELTKYKDVLRDRALLIISLPDSLLEFKTSDGNVPSEVEGIASQWSNTADRWLEHDNWIGIQNLLVPKGTYIDEPNDLEKLAEYASAIS